MTLYLYEILIIVFVHWIGDFVLQTHWQATNKSKSNDTLHQHVTGYTIVWFAPMIFLFHADRFNVFGCFGLTLFFMGVTYFFHYFTDYFTSRLNSRLWENNRVHDFFVSIGWDQVLHYTQLFTTYYLLKNI